jgi:hypothetical protein
MQMPGYASTAGRMVRSANMHWGQRYFLHRRNRDERLPILMVHCTESLLWNLQSANLVSLVGPIQRHLGNTRTRPLYTCTHDLGFSASQNRSITPAFAALRFQLLVRLLIQVTTLIKQVYTCVRTGCLPCFVRQVSGGCFFLDAAL